MFTRPLDLDGLKMKVKMCRGSQQNQVFNSLAEQNLQSTKAVAWDGKKSDSLTREEYGDGNQQNKIVKKEIITVMDAENESFIGDFQPDSGEGKTVAKGVMEKMVEKGILLLSILFICGDSTAANT